MDKKGEMRKRKEENASLIENFLFHIHSTRITFKLDEISILPL